MEDALHPEINLDGFFSFKMHCTALQNIERYSTRSYSTVLNFRTQHCTKLLCTKIHLVECTALNKLEKNEPKSELLPFFKGKFELNAAGGNLICFLLLQHFQLKPDTLFSHLGGFILQQDSKSPLMALTVAVKLHVPAHTSRFPNWQSN